MHITIYHNPRCRKSREALQILQEKGLEPEIIQYLKEVPSVDELDVLFKKIGIEPQEGIRKGEKDFQENFKGKELSRSEWLKSIHDYPKLLERAVVVNGDKAIIARPPEKALEVL